MDNLELMEKEYEMEKVHSQVGARIWARSL
jgi:hypothetical protein